MDRTSKLVVLALITNSSGEILLSQRFDPDFPDAHLRWDIPGGTNEWGESPERTAEREALEETGLIVSVDDMLPMSVSRIWIGAHVEQHTIVLCYRCRMIGGTLYSDDPKIKNLHFVAPQDLAGYDFLPTTRQFLDMAYPA